jgi:hypothetical protein
MHFIPTNTLRRRPQNRIKAKPDLGLDSFL